MRAKKTRRVAVVANTRAGKVVVGSMENINDDETFDFDGEPAISLKLARMNGYPHTGEACRERVVVGAGGKVRG